MSKKLQPGQRPLGSIFASSQSILYRAGAARWAAQLQHPRRDDPPGHRGSRPDSGQTSYADFEELNRSHPGMNSKQQPELMLASIETRYIGNRRGKNTADMKIADDIHTLMEKLTVTHIFSDLSRMA